jgi:peptidoglycan/LPS O-acetylase OafA/YrhL
LPIVYGCLLAQLLDRDRSFRILKTLGSTWGAAAAFALFMVLQLASLQAAAIAPEYLQLYVFGATLLIASLVTSDGWLARSIGAPPMAWLGRLSYGIYLVHILALVVGHRVFRDSPGDPLHSVPSYLLSCAISVAIAEVLARSIERPCIAFGRKLSKKLLEDRAKQRDRELEPA